MPAFAEETPSFQLSPSPLSGTDIDSDAHESQFGNDEEIVLADHSRLYCIPKGPDILTFFVLDDGFTYTHIGSSDIGNELTGRGLRHYPYSPPAPLLMKGVWPLGQLIAMVNRPYQWTLPFLDFIPRLATELRRELERLRGFEYRAQLLHSFHWHLAVLTPRCCHSRTLPFSSFVC